MRQIANQIEDEQARQDIQNQISAIDEVDKQQQKDRRKQLESEREEADECEYWGER